MVKHISKSVQEILEYIDKKRKGEIKELRTRWKKVDRNMPIEWHSLYTIAGISGFFSKWTPLLATIIE